MYTHIHITQLLYTYLHDMTCYDMTWKVGREAGQAGADAPVTCNCYMDILDIEPYLSLSLYIYIYIYIYIYVYIYIYTYESGTLWRPRVWHILC